VLGYVCKIGNPKTSIGETMPPKKMSIINTMTPATAIPIGGARNANQNELCSRSFWNMVYHVSKNMKTSTKVKTTHAVFDKDFIMS
jgi:hypothetical protein